MQTTPSTSHTSRVRISTPNAALSQSSGPDSRLVFHHSSWRWLLALTCHILTQPRDYPGWGFGGIKRGQTQKSWDPVVQASYCRCCSIPEVLCVYYTTWIGRRGYYTQISKEEGLGSLTGTVSIGQQSSGPKMDLGKGYLDVFCIHCQHAPLEPRKAIPSFWVHSGKAMPLP